MQRDLTSTALNVHWFANGKLTGFPSMSGSQNRMDVDIWTTPDNLQWIRVGLTDALESHGFQLHGLAMPHGFPADCGFQAIGWIISMLTEEDCSVPWTMHQAFQWRTLFHQHLQDRQQDLVIHPLQLGGMKSQHDQLTELVIQHGVAEFRGAKCAQQLIQALNSKAITQVLTSPRPWADLKSKASLQQIRVVLASKLQAVIERRSNDPKPLGRKHTKAKPDQKVPKKILAA